MIDGQGRIRCCTCGRPMTPRTRFNLAAIEAGGRQDLSFDCAECELTETVPFIIGPRAGPVGSGMPA